MGTAFSSMGGFSALFFFAFFLIFGVVIFSVIKSVADRARNNSLPVSEEHAEVVSKRMEVSGNSEGSSTSYYASFERDNGERIELRMGGREYGALAEGDRGRLRWQGNRLVGFERQVWSEPEPEQPRETDDVNGWHKCEACGATYKGPVCDYCDTPYRRS